MLNQMRLNESSEKWEPKDSVPSAENTGLIPSESEDR